MLRRRRWRRLRRRRRRWTCSTGLFTAPAVNADRASEVAFAVPNGKAATNRKAAATTHHNLNRISSFLRLKVGSLSIFARRRDLDARADSNSDTAAGQYPPGQRVLSSPRPPHLPRNKAERARRLRARSNFVAMA
jgi:hypothetical protein